MRLRYYADVIRLELDESKCVNCKMCIEVCPHEVFAVKEDQVVIADRGACMECGACDLNCPANAIKAGRGVGCAAGIIRGKLGGKDACC